MKQIFQSLLLGFALTFVSCSEKLIEGGESYADFTVTGTIKSLSGGTPLGDIVVTTTSYLKGGEVTDPIVTTTIKEGHYEIKPYIPYSEYITITVEDPSGNYQGDSYQIDRKVINKLLEDEDGFFLGRGSMSGIDFALKAK